jgi:hypothetical protein
MYKVINVVIFVLFLLVFALEGVRGRLKAAKVFKTSALVLGMAVLVLVLGELVAYLSALIAGANFKLFGTIYGITFDNIAMIASIVLLAAASVAVYMNGRTKAVRKTSGSMRANAASNAAAKYAGNILFGSLALMLVLSAALLFAIGENLMFLIPLTFATIAMVLYHMTSLKVWMVLAIGMTLLHASSFSSPPFRQHDN